MIKIIIFILISLFILLLFKEIHSEYAFLLKLSVFILLVAFCIEEYANDFIDLIYTFEELGIESKILSLLIKTLILCVTTQILSNLCKDCGETAIGTGLEFAGRISVFMLGFPVINELIEIISGWIKQ